MGLNRDVAAQPGEIPHRRSCRGDDHEQRFRQARHSQVRLYAAALIKPLCVNDFAGINGHVVGTEPLQHRPGIAALDAEFCEG